MRKESLKSRVQLEENTEHKDLQLRGAFHYHSGPRMYRRLEVWPCQHRDGLQSLNHAHPRTSERERQGDQIRDAAKKQQLERLPC